MGRRQSIDYHHFVESREPSDVDTDDELDTSLPVNVVGLGPPTRAKKPTPPPYAKGLETPSSSTARTTDAADKVAEKGTGSSHSGMKKEASDGVDGDGVSATGAGGVEGGESHQVDTNPAVGDKSNPKPPLPPKRPAHPNERAAPSPSSPDREAPVAPLSATASLDQEMTVTPRNEKTSSPPVPSSPPMSTAAKLASVAVLGGLAYAYASRRADRAAAAARPSAAKCVPFVIHGGGALTRELIRQCPVLSEEYALPAWCTNPHAQSLLGYARACTIFLKYDRQLVECADGGQIGMDWLVHARFAKPAPVPPTPPGRRGARAQAQGQAQGRGGAGVGASEGTRGGTPSAGPAGMGVSHSPLPPPPPPPLTVCPYPPPPPPKVSAHNIPNAADLPRDAPVFIMLHGINGGSHEGPTKWAIATGAVRGWRCVALNLRGCNGGLASANRIESRLQCTQAVDRDAVSSLEPVATMTKPVSTTCRFQNAHTGRAPLRSGVPLTSPKVYCAASSEDVRAAVNAVRARFPSAPILLAGYSLGTFIIGTYLAEEDSKRRDGSNEDDNGGDNGVVGAVLISCPLDPHSSHAGLSDPERPAGLIYNAGIASELRRYFLRHKKAVSEHPDHGDTFDALEVSDLRTIKDFEQAIIIKTHGFASLEEYYDYISPARLIPCIRTPTLYISARDDPFMGHADECEKAIRGTAHVAMAHVRMGGHVAFLEKGVGIWGPAWMDRALGEFLEATLMTRSTAARLAAASAGPAPYVVSRKHANVSDGGGGGGRDAAATEGLRAHVDPERGVHIRSKL